MTAECNQFVFGFYPQKGREIRAQFDGGAITSDGGGLLLREVEKRIGILREFAACFTDYRNPESHRTYGEGVGGPASLWAGPGIRRSKRSRGVAERSLAGGAGREGGSRQPSLSRKEHPESAGTDQRDGQSEGALQKDRAGSWSRGPAAGGSLPPSPPGGAERNHLGPGRHRRHPDGKKQEGRFFHGYYGHYCYLPLYIFCGEFLLCARLRSSNIDASAGSVEELERIVAQIRSAWPQVRIVVRGDSGFCREELMAWCEASGVEYLLGLAKNERLKTEIAKEMGEAKAQYQQTGRAARLFKEFVYQTRESWSRARRVVAKAEHLEKGENPRFVVTSLSAEPWPAQALYEEHYCGRGDMENRIKEQLMLFSDRTSTHYLRSNQLRLYFSSIAYVLLQMLRRLGLAGTELAQAQCSTIRLKVLKIGALIRITVRKVWVSLAGGYPMLHSSSKSMKSSAPCR